MATYKYFDATYHVKSGEVAAAATPSPGRLVVENDDATIYDLKGRPVATHEFEAAGGPVSGAEYVFGGEHGKVLVRVGEYLKLDETFIQFGRAVCRLVREDGFPDYGFALRAIGVCVLWVRHFGARGVLFCYQRYGFVIRPKARKTPLVGHSDL